MASWTMIATNRFWSSSNSNSIARGAAEYAENHTRRRDPSARAKKDCDVVDGEERCAAARLSTSKLSAAPRLRVIRFWKARGPSPKCSQRNQGQ